MDRFGNHFTSIQRNDGKNDVCKHFNDTNHKGIDDLQLHILDFIHAAPNSVFGKVLRDEIGAPPDEGHCSRNRSSNTGDPKIIDH